MDTSPGLAGARDTARPASVSRRARRRRIGTKLIGGGPDGNEQITTITGTSLLVLLTAIGVTIIFIGRLLWLHLFLGPALILLIPDFSIWTAHTALLHHDHH